MKKLKLFSLVIAIALFVTTGAIVTTTYATETDQILTIGAEDEILTTTTEDGEEQIVLDQNSETPDIYEGDLYVFFGEEEKTATKYVMDKMVDGNVFIFGNEVEVTGQINGSLYVFATKLTVGDSAYIGMDLFAFAQDITMSGYAFDIYAACSNFEFTHTGVAYRDLKLGTNNAHLVGSVGRNIDLGANSISVYDDDENKLFVGNDLNYSSENQIEHIDDITVYGEVKFEKEEVEEEDRNVAVDFVTEAIGKIVFALVIYVTFLFLAPKFVEKSREYISTRGLLASAIGLAFTILVPIIAFLFIFANIRLAFALGAVYAVVLMLNSSIVTIAINEFLCNKFEKINSTWKKILMILPVSLVLFLITKIPFLGGIVSMVVFLVGVGIIILYQFDKRSKKEKVTE